MVDVIESLPRVDEHEVVIEAESAAVWRAVSDTMWRSSSGEKGRQAFAAALGCQDRGIVGPPGEEGSTITGFRVASSRPPVELALVGRHRFSRYALIFRIDELEGRRARLRAETRASFPGMAGRAYRTLVIGSRAHTVLVRRMLAAIKRRTERMKGS